MKNEFDYLNDVKMDFSCYEGFMEKETKTMKKRRIARSEKVLIAACVTVLAVTTVFASGVVNNVIKMVSTGHNNVYQYDSSMPQPLPDFLKGQLFDRDGKAVDSLGKSGLDDIYDANGEKITQERFEQMFEELSGGLVMVGDNAAAEKRTAEFASLDEAQNAAVFDIKTPAYIPDGYSLARIYAYTDDDGSMSGEYINLEYRNDDGSSIEIYERTLNENTAFEMGTDATVEEILVNGRRAALVDNKGLFFETEDNVSVSIMTHGEISGENIIKIAESMD